MGKNGQGGCSPQSLQPPVTPSHRIMPTQRLLGFGTALVDLLAHVEDSFIAPLPVRKGGTVHLETADHAALVKRLPLPPQIVPGGAAANTLVGFAQLNGKGSAGLLSAVGNDEFGEFYRQAVQQAGVDISRCRITDDFPTGTCLSLITPDAERTMCTLMGANDFVTCNTFSLNDFTGYTHFLIEGYTLYNPALTECLLRLAHEAGLTIAMDINSSFVAERFRAELQELLPRYVSIIIANEQEATTFAQTDSEQEALDCLSELCPLSILKLGVRGVMIQQRGENPIGIPAFPVNPVDTTGAGDLWAAGFLSAFLNGKSAADAAVTGARVAAEVVQVTGAQLSEDTWEKLRSFL